MNGKKVSKTNPRAMVVCVGDPAVDPPQPWQTKTVKGEKWHWGKRHFSVKYGGASKAVLLWAVSPQSWVICFLHLRLRLTAMVFACCCLQWLDRAWKPTPEEVDVTITKRCPVSTPLDLIPSLSMCHTEKEWSNRWATDTSSNGRS